jgi:hypothetical protein
MGCYAENHHAANITELAWRFVLEFLDDVILSAGCADDDARADVFSRDLGLAASARIEGDVAHSLLAGVREARRWHPQ